MELSAFVLGLAGSMHCAGMCSPLLMAITGISKQAFLRRMVYNLGRILTYVIIGLVFALVGSIVTIGPYQNVISIILGVSLIIGALFKVLPDLAFVTTRVGKLLGLLKIQFSRLLASKNSFSVFLMGMLNGLLPCGLTFVALTYCMLSGTVTGGGLFMLMFGLGTLPIMLGFGQLLLTVTKWLKLSFSQVNIALTVLAGLTMIGRAFMHLGIDLVQYYTDIVVCR